MLQKSMNVNLLISDIHDMSLVCPVTLVMFGIPEIVVVVILVKCSVVYLDCQFI